MTSTQARRRAVFLDRDGVINENRADHVKARHEFVFLPDVLSALRALAALPLAVVVISNQSAIGRGLVTRRAVEDINRGMVAAVAEQGGRIDGVYLCPHRPDEGCACRKPKPGLLAQAAQELGLALATSYLVGDATTDVQAALAAGCRPVLVLSGRGQEQLARLNDDERRQTHIAAGLADAVRWIAEIELSREGATRA